MLVHLDNFKQRCTLSKTKGTKMFDCVSRAQDAVVLVAYYCLGQLLDVNLSCRLFKLDV